MDGGQHIVGVGVLCRKCQTAIRGSCCRGHPIHLVVGVVGLCTVGILRILHRLQHIGVDIVVVGSGLACCICCGDHTVAVRGIGSGGLDGLATADDLHGSVVTVGVISELIDHTGIGSRLGHIVIVIVDIGKGSTGRKDLLGEVIVGVR